MTSQADGVTPQQANYLTEGLSYLEQFGWVKVAMWYSARNNPFQGDADQMEAQYGLFTTDWQTKPAYEALTTYRAEARPQAESGRQEQLATGRRKEHEGEGLRSLPQKAAPLPPPHPREGHLQGSPPTTRRPSTPFGSAFA
jgi:hypothetical protein